VRSGVGVAMFGILEFLIAVWQPEFWRCDFLGIDSLPQKEYLCRMETVTIKMERKHVALLKAQAKVLGRSRAAVVRDLIDQHLAQKKHPSLHDLARDYCGSISGPADMSTRKLTGYGRD
jgi:hypothetical protein